MTAIRQEPFTYGPDLSYLFGPGIFAFGEEHQNIQCDPHGSGRCVVFGPDGKLDKEKTDALDKQLRDGNCALGNFLKAPGGELVSGAVAVGTLTSALFDAAHVLNRTLGPVGYILSGAWLVGEGLTMTNCK